MKEKEGELQGFQCRQLLYGGCPGRVTQQMALCSDPIDSAFLRKVSW